MPTTLTTTVELLDRSDLYDDMDVITVRYRPAGEWSDGKVWTVIAHSDGRDTVITPNGTMYSDYFEALPPHVAQFLNDLDSSNAL